MNSMSRILHRIGSRGLLLSLVGLLLLIKLGLMLYDSYKAEQIELESRRASLVRYQKLTGKVPELRRQLQSLTAEREKLRQILFTGTSEENIISGMQLDLQALVATAGLESEAIRPIKQKNVRAGGDEFGLGEVAIKASLTGTLAEYLTFLAALYGSDKFYKVEMVTLSPYKNSEVKILIDLRGYFVTTVPEVAANVESGGPGQTAEEPGK